MSFLVTYKEAYKAVHNTLSTRGAITTVVLRMFLGVYVVSTNAFSDEPIRVVLQSCPLRRTLPGASLSPIRPLSFLGRRFATGGLHHC